MLHLDEADSAFDEPPRGEHLHPEVARRGIVQPVELLRRLSLDVEVEDIGDRGLHPEGEFIRFDPRGQRRVIRVLDSLQAVQSADEIEADLLFLAAQSSRRLAEVERVVRIDADRNRIVSRPEVMPVLRVPVLAVPHRDELRQVVVEAAESVMDPRAERRVFPVEHVATRMKLRLSAMIVVGRPHRTHDRQVIDTAPHVRHPVAQFDPGLAVLLMPDLQRIKLVPLLPVGVVHHGDARELELLRILSLLVRRLVDRLATVLGQLGLRIEALHVRHTAVHEQPDNIFCFRREVGLTVRRHSFGRSFSPHNTIPRKHRPQRETGEPQPHVCEKRATMNAARTRVRILLNVCHADSPSGRGSAQSSILNPGICSKSMRLRVTSVASSSRAMAAMARSILPMRRNCRRSSACRSIAECEYGRISITPMALTVLRSPW